MHADLNMLRNIFLSIGFMTFMSCKMTSIWLVLSKYACQTELKMNVSLSKNNLIT